MPDGETETPHCATENESMRPSDRAITGGGGQVLNVATIAPEPYYSFLIREVEPGIECPV